MKNCPNCGTQIADDSQFCTECGKSIPQGNVCSHCGAQVNDGDAFCPNCGSKVDEVDGQQSTSAAAPEQKHCPHCGAKVSIDSLFCESCGRNMVDGSSVPNTMFQPQVPYTQKSSSHSKVILPLIIGLLMLALGGGGWWYYKSSNSLQKGNTAVMSNETSADSIVSTDTNSKEYITNYLNEIFPKAIKMSEKQAIEKYFTKEFASLYQKVEDYDNKYVEDGDIGFWDSDFWTGSQDGELASIKVLDISDLSQNKATALVQYVIKFGDYDESKSSCSLYLVLENEKWRIDDFNNYKDRFKDYLESANSSNNNSGSYVGRTYKGSGKGGGIYTEMTITFLDGNKCRCTSDWYQAYPEGKTLNGTYEVRDGHVAVHCTYEYDYDFNFEVHKSGRALSFNNSDDSVEGTIGLNYMTLELSD